MVGYWVWQGRSMAGCEWSGGERGSRPGMRGERG